MMKYDGTTKNMMEIWYDEAYYEIWYDAQIAGSSSSI
jgi:hypothetical protein